MKLTIKKYFPCLMFIVFFISNSLAGPQIKIEPEVYKCGEVDEGKTKIVRAVYIVRNTGDKELRLHSVKPGCGCTVVKYDSIVAPKDSCRISAELDITGYSGHVYKGITVNSNDENSPVIRVSIDVVINSPLSVTPRYISGTSATVIELAVSSRRKDLHILDVQFIKADESEDDVPVLEDETDKSLRFELIRDEKLKKSKMSDYRLKLFLPKVTTLTYGKFVLYTDHPDRKTVEIIGSISL